MEQGEEEDGLLWNKNEYRLGELTDKLVLPQVVKVVCGYDQGDDGAALGFGQVVTIHSLRTSRTVLAKDTRGRDVYIPSNCTQQVEVRPSEWLDELFTVTQLVKIFPKYKCARVTQGIYTSCKQRAINVGDKLHLKEINHTGNVLICENQDKDRLCLPTNLKAGFHPLCDSGEYLVKDIIGWFQLPVHIQFIDQEPKGMENSKLYNPFIGVLVLNTVITNEEVICSSKYDGKRFMMIIPKDLNVTVVVADDTCEQNKDYLEQSRSFDHEAHLAKLEQFEIDNIYASPQAIREFRGVEFEARIANVHVEEVPPAVPPRDPNPPSRNPKERKAKTKTRATVLYSEEEKIQVQVPDDTYERIADLVLEGGDETKKGSESSNVNEYDDIRPFNKESAKLIKSKQEKENQNRGFYDVMRERVFHPQSPVRGKSSVTIQQPHRKPKDSRNIHPTNNLLSTTHRESPTSTQSSPKFLPTAQAPTAHASSVSSPCSPFSPNAQSSTGDLSDLTIAEVSNFLRAHRLGDLVKKFEQEQIDGSMLLILDPEMMKALGVNAFQAKKLLMLMEGWRPKT